MTTTTHDSMTTQTDLTSEAMYEELLKLRNSEVKASAKAFECALRADYELNPSVEDMYRQQFLKHQRVATEHKFHADALQARLAGVAA